MILSDPYTKEELKNSVKSLQNNLHESFLTFSETVFFEKPEIGWSLAENVQHINRVTKLMAFTFTAPKFLASLVFGEVGSESRRMNEIAEIYLDALSKGQQSGPFTPNSEKRDGDLTARKKALLSEWNKSWDKYGLAIENWEEEQLNKIQMPHPFLGKIPAREMYMIGILHPVHHGRIVSKRLGKDWNYF